MSCLINIFVLFWLCYFFLLSNSPWPTVCFGGSQVKIEQFITSQFVLVTFFITWLPFFGVTLSFSLVCVTGVPVENRAFSLPLDMSWSPFSYLGTISMSFLSSPPWSVSEGVPGEEKYRTFSELLSKTLMGVQTFWPFVRVRASAASVVVLHQIPSELQQQLLDFYGLNGLTFCQSGRKCSRLSCALPDPFWTTTSIVWFSWPKSFYLLSEWAQAQPL